MAQYTHERFLHKLGGYEGGVGGKRLRLALDWPKDVFDVIRNQLKEAGLIIVGRGQGGSIQWVTHIPADEQAAIDRIGEKNVT